MTYGPYIQPRSAQFKHSQPYMSQGRPVETSSDSGDSSDLENSVALEIDLDGTLLVDPLDEGTFLIDPTDVDAGSLVTVASFSHHYRVSPDNMPASREKNIKQWRRCQLLWEDHYTDISVDDIMPFQYQPSIAELTDLLGELRELQVFFEDTVGDDFSEDELKKLKDLRKEVKSMKNEIQAKGASNAPQGGATAGGGGNPIAEDIARKTYAAMEPSLRSASQKLKDSLEKVRGALPSTTAHFKRLEAKHVEINGDLELTIKQWEGLKKEAVTGKDSSAAAHCVEWIRVLETERTLTTQSMRVTTRRMGFLPGQTTFNSSVTNLKAPQFSGHLHDKMDFFTFEDSLEEYFDTIGSYNPSMKLLKLKTDCLTEPALHSIRDCTTYDDAMRELRKLFGQPRVLFTTRVTEIKNLGRCPDIPVQARTWAIELANLLKNLISLAETYSIESMFDGSNLVKMVEDNLRTRDLYKFRDRLKELRVTEDDFTLESRAKRAKYLLQFMDVLIDDATFDIDFQMTRSYKDCENVMTGKPRGNEKEKPGDKKPNSKKSYFAAAESESSDSSSEEDYEPEPRRPAKSVKKKIFTNKSEEAKVVECKLCKEEHSILSYCNKYQDVLVKDRWRQICITKSCPRCLRLDAGFRFDAREAWYKEHKDYCTDQHLCNVGKCAKRPAHTANNVTLCPLHVNDNEDAMLEYVKSLDQKSIPKNLRFFFNKQAIFSSSEPGPVPAPIPPNVDENSVIIEADIKDPAMYMLQTVKAPNGAEMLVFYDTGCYGAALSERAYGLLTTTTVRPGPTKLEVASGRVITIEHGDEQFLIELDTDGAKAKFATVTALRLDKVSTEFPEWSLQEAWDQLNQGYRADGQTADLPAADSCIGGRDVDIMIGMKYMKYYPRLLYSLPNGLSVFKAMIKGGKGNQAVLGGTSPLWKSAMKSAHSMGPAAYFVAEMRAYRHHCDSLWNSVGPAHKESCSISEVEAVTQDTVCRSDDEIVVQSIAANAPSTKLKDMLTIEDLGSSVEYRCPGCRNCSKCRNSEIIEKVSLQEEREQFLIEQSVSYDEERGKTVAKLPFIMEPTTNLSNNYNIAKKILQSQIRIAAKKEGSAEMIVKSHNKLRDKGYVKRIDELSAEEKSAADQQGYFIPWRTVESGSLSTPVRMVFDASSKTNSGYSLNCLLGKGVNMLADMMILLIRFRIGPYAFAADVSMAYNCVSLHPEHLRYHKYLWVEELNPDGEIVEMVVLTLIYGVKSAGNQTMVAFKVVAEIARRDPALEKSGGPDCLENSSYMDDIFSSFLTEYLRSQTIEGLDKTLAIGQMAVKDFTLSGQAPGEKVSVDGQMVSIVGYLWDPVEDILLLDIKPLYFGKKKRGRLPPLVEGDPREALRKKFTRREMCGKVAGVYDPLGLVTPVSAKLKLDLREIVKLQGEWDDPIDEKFLDTWVENLALIQSLADFKMARSALRPGETADSWELIICTDASQIIAAATAYLRVTVGGEARCLLVAAKSKLVSKMTVPRAELRACVLGVSLGEIVSRAYGDLISKRIYVTDSTVALSWINTDNRPLQVGVRNCVIQICRFTTPDDWYHVASEHNPADLATKGKLTTADIGPGSVWQRGHPWMSSDNLTGELTPSRELKLSNEDKVTVSSEVRATDLSGIILSMVDKVAERYEFSKYPIDPCSIPWDKYIRKIGILVRVGQIWRGVGPKFATVSGKIVVSLREEDTSAAENLVFKITSAETAHFDSKEAKKNGKWQDGVLTYTGRTLDLSELENPTQMFLDLQPLKFNVPMIDRFSPAAYSIMIFAHTKLTHHGGAISTLRASHTIAHVIRGKDLAVEVRKSCAFCKRFKAQTLEAESGKLHPAQLCVAPAFYNAQVDLFGPVNAICKHFARRELKAYCVVFKCPTSLAVAAFTMDSYDTTSFLDAFHRFCCMYGVPNKILIDAGSQLLKAFKDFHFSVIDITKTLNGEKGVEIEFGVCPVGAHESHGMVERSIREIKKVFGVMFKGLKLDMLKLETAFFWVCNELNSLPVCLGNRYVDLEQLDLITPARLLHGRNNQRAVGKLAEGPRPTRIARQIMEIESAWWQIWADQKVADFIPRPTKWREGAPNVQEGDIVVFVKERSELGGLTWRLGRVQSVERGRDGIIRRVVIEYKIDGERVFRTTRRSVRDVAILYREEELDLPGKLSEAQRLANINMVRLNLS